MKTVIKQSTMVKPLNQTPAIKLYISSLDLTAPNFHIQWSIFTGQMVMLTSLMWKWWRMLWGVSCVLPDRWMVYGRWDDWVVIDCRGQCVLFLEAESDFVIDEFGDFAPRFEFLIFVLTVDYSVEMELCPQLVCAGMNCLIIMMLEIIKNDKWKKYIYINKTRSNVTYFGWYNRWTGRLQPPLPQAILRILS